MLEQQKINICEIAKRAQRDGLCKHKSGNFSMRDPETGYVVITPTGVDREILSPRDIVIMDLDANVIENESGLKPTSECLMHLQVYKLNEKARAVVHTHSMYATTFAVLAKPIPAVVYEVMNLGLTKARIPVAPYGRPGTMGLAESINETVKEAHCMLLERHGVLTYDEESIYNAYLNACYVEEVAQLYYNALTVLQGAEPNACPAEELVSWSYPKEVKMPVR